MIERQKHFSLYIDQNFIIIYLENKIIKNKHDEKRKKHEREEVEGDH